MVREFKNPRRLPGAWPCSKSLRSLGFYSLFLFRADQISDSAACLASGLAGSLAFAAAAVLCTFAEVAGFESFNTLHNIVLHNIIFRSLAAAEKFSSVIYYHKARQKSICLPTFCNLNACAEGINAGVLRFQCACFAISSTKRAISSFEFTDFARRATSV